MSISIRKYHVYNINAVEHFCHFINNRKASCDGKII